MKEWRDISDPENRIYKGALIHWNHSKPGDCDMIVLRLSNPMGLYTRPVRDSDSKLMQKMAQNLGGLLPCESDDIGAVYCPENLVVHFQYLDGTESNGRAIDVTVIETNKSDVCKFEDTK